MKARGNDVIGNVTKRRTEQGKERGERNHNGHLFMGGKKNKEEEYVCFHFASKEPIRLQK